jgi:hypothetical protein
MNGSDSMFSSAPKIDDCCWESVWNLNASKTSSAAA